MHNWNNRVDMETSKYTNLIRYPGGQLLYLAFPTKRIFFSDVRVNDRTYCNLDARYDETRFIRHFNLNHNIHVHVVLRESALQTRRTQYTRVVFNTAPLTIRYV